MFDGEAFGREIVAATKAHVDRSLGPILARIDAIEAKLAAPAAVGEEDLSAVKSDVESLRKAMAEWTAPKELEAPELPDIPAIVREAVAAIDMPEPKEVDPALIKQMVDEAVGALPAPKPGKDVEMAEVTAKVASEVERVLAGWDRPKNGDSVTVEQLAPLVAESVQKAVAAIPTPKDGCGVKELLIDRDGALVASMDDGRMKNLGRVVGADGLDADMAALKAHASEVIAALPKAKDGLDGVGFDDLDLVDTGAGIVLRFTKGDVVKDFPLPVVIDRGVWKEGAYVKGSGVTWGGSFWIAQEDTTEKPETGKGWRLAVKKGRDGKDKA